MNHKHDMTCAAVAVTKRLQAELEHDVFFAQAVAETDEATCAVLTVLVQRSRLLRSNRQTEVERIEHERVKAVLRHEKRPIEAGRSRRRVIRLSRQKEVGV